MGAEKTKKVQDNESKADKFVRLGEYRVNKVIDAIGRLENLFNRTNYEYTQEQEIAEKVGDFYMLPSSIHETLIIPKDAGMEFKELEQMVQEENQKQVAPGERLSDHVYEYDAKEHELFRSDRAEERAKQKEEKRDNRHERVSVKEKLAEKKDAVIKMNAGKEHSAPEKKKEAVI